VLLCTPNGCSHELGVYEAAGIKACLDKPVDTVELLEQLAIAMGR